MPVDFYFSSDDVPSMTGSLVAFFFNSFSGGTLPGRSNDLSPVATVLHPFIAALPRALLGRGEGGALAVIGHVDLAWTYSFQTPSPEAPIERLTQFKQIIAGILRGYPVGAAMEIFGLRYAALATDLSDEILALQRGNVPDDETLFRLWLCQDARNYIVLGDPAVRLVPSDAEPFVSAEPGSLPSPPPREEARMSGPPILYFSGLNSETGAYANSPATPRELACLAQKTLPGPQEAETLEEWRRAAL